MGFLLSVLLAELFMDHFEKNLFSSPHPLIKQTLWKRNVDDVFCILVGKEGDINDLLNVYNNLHWNIKLSCKIAKDELLNFLDLTSQLNGNKIIFKIFRKPSYTDQVVPNFSSHHPSYKYTAFHAMIHDSSISPSPTRTTKN